MRRFKYLAAAMAITGLLAGSATAASAATSQPARAQAAAAAHLRSGTTAVTTAPGIAAALLTHGIVPLATWPGSQSVQSPASGPAVRFTFPVTGGRVTLSPLGGTIDHRGGILFSDPKTGKKIAVSNFTISLTHQVLTGIVNGNPHARVPLFHLGLAHAVLKAHHHWVTARGIVLRLTKTAATALNTTFATTLFKPGLKIGTAVTKIRI